VGTLIIDCWSEEGLEESMGVLSHHTTGFEYFSRKYSTNYLDN
jgi:hypothetical protein